MRDALILISLELIVYFYFKFILETIKKLVLVAF